jgi:hypothetical protein
MRPECRIVLHLLIILEHFPDRGINHLQNKLFSFSEIHYG